jgi:hypothetical protein
MSAGQLSIDVYLVDREPYTVSTTLQDHNTWDLTRARHKWPTAQDAPLTWMGFLAWAASRRTGAIEAGLTWELFLSQCLSVEKTEDEEEVIGPVDPIQLAPGLA